MAKTLEQRFWAKVKKTRGCWRWGGCSDSDGFGIISENRRAVRVHRLSWELHNGKIPRGRNLTHTCGDKQCANPRHIRINDPNESFWSRVKKSKGCWIYAGGSNGRGYGRQTFNGCNEQAHRISWMLTFGKIPGGMHVLHKCDIRLCVNPAHLFLGTNNDNVADRMKKGRGSRGKKHSATLTPEKMARRGETHGFAKLTESQVREIRRLYATKKYRHSDLAKKYKMADTAIGAIVRRATWSHLSD